MCYVSLAVAVILIILTSTLVSFIAATSILSLLYVISTSTIVCVNKLINLLSSLFLFNKLS